MQLKRVRYSCCCHAVTNESGRRQEDLDMTLEGKVSMVSPENSVATSVIVNQTEPGHAS